MIYVNWIAILCATISSSLLSYLWYSSVLFGKQWKKEVNPPIEKTFTPKWMQAFALTVMINVVYAFMLARIRILTDFSGMADGFKLGFMVGICFSAMGLGAIYHISKRSVNLYFIDAGFLVVSSTMMGSILGWVGN